ncbi:MAG: CNNM domain-containing protein [Phycisphaerae bacterium]
MITWTVSVAVLLLGLLLSAFFSGTETGIYCMSRVRLHLAAKRRDPRALRLESILDDEAGALAVTLIGTNLMNYVTTTACAFMLAELVGSSQINTELYTVLLLTPAVFVFGEVVPKNLFRLHADTLMPRSAWLLNIANRILRSTGCVALFKHLSMAVNQAVGERPVQALVAHGPKRRVALLLQDALVEHPLGPQQSKLIERVCQLSEAPVQTAMVPWDRVVSIAANADRRMLTRLARTTHHAQVPVFDSRRRNIIGLVTIDSLLEADGWTVVREHLESAICVSPHDMIPSVISRIRAAGGEMAIVTDRTGQMLGIATLRDLLAEVVGELGNGV